MKTHIPEFDQMLGKLPHGWQGTEAMLIRGAPGSGKTSLALEILARNITRPTPEEEAKGMLVPKFAIFVSLEVDPLVAWKTVCERLEPTLIAGLPTERNKKGESDFKKVPNIRGAKISTLSSEHSKLLVVGRNWLDSVLPYSDWHGVEEQLKSAFKDLIKGFDENKQNEETQKGTQKEELKKQTQVQPKESEHGLIVIDSVNLLADIVNHKISSPGEPADMRAVMHGIWNILDRQRSEKKSPDEASSTMPSSTPPTTQSSPPPPSRANLILVGEHHPGAPYDVSLLSESFACDIEVLLAPEPIAGKPTIPANLLGPLGYAFERRELAKPFSEEPQSIEIRSFCRVLKSRFRPNQSRRCAYDMVEGRGIVFTETYPGDGAMLLFYENGPQKKMWEEFLAGDAQLQFPSLRYRLFDPPAVQRTFATQRQFHRLHQKTDMYIASFDTYWITWYWQLARRMKLKDYIIQTMAEVYPSIDTDKQIKDNKEKHEAWCRFICHIDRVTRDLMDKGKKEVELKFVDDARDHFGSFIKLVSPETKTAPQDFLVKLSENIKKAIEAMRKGEIGLTKLIEKEKLRLFGEFQSPIIKQLEDDDRPDNRIKDPDNPKFRSPRKGVHHSRMANDDQNWVSVPYNANVSFMVFQEQVLTKLKKVCWDGKKLKPEFQKKLNEFHQRQSKALETFIQQQTKDYTGPEHEEKITPIDIQSLTEDELCNTWEGLIILCEAGKQLRSDQQDAKQQQSEAADPEPTHIVIETLTFDSLLCAILEVFWGCGGELEISPEFQITNRRETEKQLFLAFFLLRELFYNKIIETDSTVKPTAFGQRYAKKADDRWLAARHWYSTLIDILTAKSVTEEDLQACGDGAISDSAPWAWNPGNKPKLRISPLPYSRFAAFEQKKEKLPQVACWGEWHFAVLNGTENETLAIEIINHFMGSNAISQRAQECSALPTVEKYYERYENIPCVRVPGRSDIKPPTMTYGEIRDQILEIAQSRRTIFDYAHCMRELHSVLKEVQHQKEEERLSDKRLATLVLDAIDRITNLREQEMMIH